MEIAKQRIADWISAGDLTAVLVLCELGLTKFPDGLPSGLQSLSLSNNQIREIPDALPASLQCLYLNINQIREIPPTLPSGLLYLALCGNQIREIPPIAMAGHQGTLPSCLRCLHIGGNQITEIPETLPRNLQDLHLNNNPVFAGPSTSCKMAGESWSSYARRLTEEKEAARAAIRCLAFRDELCYATTTMSH